MKKLVSSKPVNTGQRKRKFVSVIGAFLFTMMFVSLTAHAQVKNVVIVHGAWADGSGWESVYKILKSKGYNISVVANSDLGFKEDVASTRAVLARQTGPVILVGHSYGGAVITEAGDTANVVALVYVAAFAPDAGESLFKMLEGVPPNPDSAILPPKDGLLWLDVAKFHRDFCPDLPADKADFLAISQVPVGLAAFGTPLTKAAWKTKPSWFIVAKDDRMIPPDAERGMAKRAGSKVTEIKSSHVVYMSHPKEVATVIEAAANGAVK